ncbi:esterase family protein [Paenibacillus psychroresistens]|uniref:Esterase family protein n=1 Tax=Paenibacillus psychroresistens TaxID=1778678 RepID=A0A6B8RSV6_9BACL|nr:alpha/beta hydrolase family protein [Paenibacillus psychroresistens]QGQ98894.1 esterase family protein [Paenibacillus psychroresistens]
MAFIQCSFYSEALGLSTSMSVILPQQTTTQIGMAGNVIATKHPTLYLLHGLSDDHSIWMRRTSIERYASELGIAVVMPSVHRSFYADMANGMKFWTFISEELPAIARSFFPLSEKREDNFVAGLSMGGFGAFKLALNHPEQYAAAASLSGALIAENVFDLSLADAELIYKDRATVKGSNSDLIAVAERLAKSDQLKPLLYQICGTEDFLYEDNKQFRESVETLDLSLKYTEGPGDHSWAFWDEHIQNVLKWLPLKK